MRSSSSLVLLLAALGSGLAACSDPVDTPIPPVDGGNSDVVTPVDGGGSDAGPSMDVRSDTGTRDAGTGDAGTGDTGGDRPAVDGGPAVDPCSMAAVVDLNTAGTRAGATTRITRSNATAPRNSTLRAPCSSAARQVAFRYTPTATGRLFISTDNAGTSPMTFDTVVWAQTACSPISADGGTAMSLGCNDDNATAPRTLASRFVTSAAVTAGTPIFILVGGFGDANSTGTFELSVTEVTTVNPGGVCDPTGMASVCATGSLCAAATGATMGTCVAAGAQGGACRAMGMACDAGLACSGLATSAFSRCRTAVAPGAACDPLRVMNVCSMESICVAATSGAMMGTCVAAGAQGGACRSTGMACDAGLACTGSVTSSLSRCRTAAAVGAACDPRRVMNVCVPDSTCVTRNNASTCVRSGTVGGNCRSDEPRCEPPLSCSGSSSSGTCRTVVAAGGACESNNGSTVCAAGGSCVPTAPGAAMGTCRAAGTAAGTSCRDAAMRCDAGLTCSTMTGSGTCRTMVAAGGACTTNNSTTFCEMGSACIPATPGSATGTCRAAGSAAGTACRAEAPRCDTGLDCSTMTGSGVCRRTVASGAACIPASASELCAMGTACRPMTSVAGTCTMGTAETEPNNTPMAAQAAVTASTVFSGMATMADPDCFAVTVPMGASLFAESNLPATPACPSGGPDPVITIYDPSNDELSGVDDGRGLCGTVRGATDPDLRNLPAGRYTVCIEAFNMMPINYLLTVGVYATPAP